MYMYILPMPGRRGPRLARPGDRAGAARADVRRRLTGMHHNDEHTTTTTTTTNHDNVINSNNHHTTATTTTTTTNHNHNHNHDNSNPFVAGLRGADLSLALSGADSALLFCGAKSLWRGSRQSGTKDARTEEAR